MFTQGSGSLGHRAVPHTADLRIEAWAPTREECLTEAVRGLVESFADVTGARPGPAGRCRVAADTDEDLLVAVLEEVIYRMDVYGTIPAAAWVRPASGGAVELGLCPVPVTEVELTGAVPKAVSLHGLRCAPDPAGGWSASVTVDV